MDTTGISPCAIGILWAKIVDSVRLFIISFFLKTPCGRGGSDAVLQAAAGSRAGPDETPPHPGSRTPPTRAVTKQGWLYMKRKERYWLHMVLQLRTYSTLLVHNTPGGEAGLGIGRPLCPPPPTRIAAPPSNSLPGSRPRCAACPCRPRSKALTFPRRDVSSPAASTTLMLKVRRV